LYLHQSSRLVGRTVYAVVGSSKIDPGQPDFPHKVMYHGNQTNGGSLILEIEENRLMANGCLMMELSVTLYHYERVNKVT
jgi:hypothetical protein